MRRRILNALSMLSLALLLAACAFWIRSVHHSDFIRFATTTPVLWSAPRNPVEAAARERLRQQMGWDGLYRFRSIGAIVSPGKLYLYQDADGEFVSDRNKMPGRLRAGSYRSVDYSAADRFLAGPGVTTKQWLGLSFSQMGIGSVFDTRRIGIPLSYLVLILLILPTFWLLNRVILPGIRAIRRHRASQNNTRGLCRACGYDLRATPGRCPECGTVPG